jgi:diguanylate cyclase (GGDEF)-like protein
MNLHAYLPEDSVSVESAPAIFYDALTGLANRSLFNDRLEHGLALARRHDLTLAVMYLDLDAFKAVNDAHGPEVGDALLQTVADRLRENTRDDDTVSRVGGDEFLYLVMGVNDVQTVAKLAKDIVNCIQAPCHLSVGLVSIQLSVGIARFPKDGATAEVLVKKASVAMHQAKRDRSEYVFAS